MTRLIHIQMASDIDGQVGWFATAHRSLGAVRNAASTRAIICKSHWNSETRKRAVWNLQPQGDGCYTIALESPIDGQSGWTLTAHRSFPLRSEDSTYVMLHRPRGWCDRDEPSWRLIPAPGYPKDHYYIELAVDLDGQMAWSMTAERSDARCHQSSWWILRRDRGQEIRDRAVWYVTDAARPEAEPMKQRNNQKPSKVFEMPDLIVEGEPVSHKEIEFFQENGFLVKRGLLDPTKLSVAFDQIWQHLVDNVPRLKGSAWLPLRDDETTWPNPQWAEMRPRPTSGQFKGRHPIEHRGRVVKMHDLGGVQYILNLFPNDQRVGDVVRTLLGGPLRPTTRIRGIYAVFPGNPSDSIGAEKPSGASLSPHIDKGCQQLNACAYLDDVPPRCGGFTVYPGSHALIFRTHEYEANHSPTELFEEQFQKVVEDIVPYELVAEKGSVIFWHGRLVHSAGIHTGVRIRWAAFADFTHDREVLSDEEHDQCGQFEWFKGVKLFKDDLPVSDNMWRHWRMGADEPQHRKDDDQTDAVVSQNRSNRRKSGHQRQREAKWRSKLRVETPSPQRDEARWLGNDVGTSV